MNSFNDEFPTKLVTMLEKRGITQKKLAQNSNLSSTVLSKILSGLRKDVTAQEVQNISKTLNIPPCYFFGQNALTCGHLKGCSDGIFFGKTSIVEKVYENRHSKMLVLVNYFLNTTVIDSSKKMLFGDLEAQMELIIRVEKGSMTVDNKEYGPGEKVLFTNTTETVTIVFNSGAMVHSVCMGDYEGFLSRLDKHLIRKTYNSRQDYSSGMDL